MDGNIHLLVRLRRAFCRSTIWPGSNCVSPIAPGGYTVEVESGWSLMTGQRLMRPKVCVDGTVRMMEVMTRCEYRDPLEWSWNGHRSGELVQERETVVPRSAGSSRQAQARVSWVRHYNRLTVSV